ncbi:DMT family transporter [uncultured Gemella sp.]|uniref:DMT family transporter n=1 Tax=uncultured Gemella sp. TaxID=254352 RepID=UPI0028D42497|nr:DMT family transporter [uncultured Gemella sp.]
MRKFISELLLIIVTIIWGLAFIWQNITSKVLGPLTVVGIRSVIAVVFLGGVAMLVPSLYKSQDPKMLAEPTTKKQSWLLGGICGIVLFFAMYIAQVGIGMTTAGKAGFITVLYICIVPFIGVFLGNKLNKFFVVGLILSVIGFYFLSVKEEIALETGDLIVLVSAVLFGLHIIVIDYSAVRVNSMFLSLVQLIVVSVLSLVLAVFKETIIFSDIMSVVWPLLGIGVLSSGVGYTLQIVGQKDVPPHTASLILSLESVVAAIGGVLILGEHIGIREGIGMFIVFAGIIVSQLPDKKKD